MTGFSEEKLKSLGLWKEWRQIPLFSGVGVVEENKGDVYFFLFLYKSNNKSWKLCETMFEK